MKNPTQHSVHVTDIGRFSIQAGVGIGQFQAGSRGGSSIHSDTEAGEQLPCITDRDTILPPKGKPCIASPSLEWHSVDVHAHGRSIADDPGRAATVTIDSGCTPMTLLRPPATATRPNRRQLLVPVCRVWLHARVTAADAAAGWRHARCCAHHHFDSANEGLRDRPARIGPALIEWCRNKNTRGRWQIRCGGTAASGSFGTQRYAIKRSAHTLHRPHLHPLPSRIEHADATQSDVDRLTYLLFSSILIRSCQATLK